MRHHYNQSSRENATPSNGTSQLATEKEVPPGHGTHFVWLRALSPVNLRNEIIL